MKRLNTLTEFARVINSDRYQYTESDIFLMEKMEHKIATFDVFFRKTEDGGFAVVAGIQEVLDLIHILNETSEDRKSTRLNSSHANISYAVFCLKKKKNKHTNLYYKLLT